MSDGDRWKSLLLDLLRPRVSPAASAWTDDAASRFAGPNRHSALLEAYTSAPRRYGRASLDLTFDERARIEQLDPDVAMAGWTTSDLGRVVLLHHAHAAASDEGASTDLLLSAYEQGDSSEQRSWLRGLPVMPRPERFVAAAVDSCRTNILPQFESIACENPFPSRHFPERNFNQLVLKALFNSLPMMRIVGLERRFNAELSRMADDYVSEREAAGRSVPADIWLVIGPYAAGTSIDRMQRYLVHDDPAHRHWAGLGLGLAKGAAPNVQRTR